MLSQLFGVRAIVMVAVLLTLLAISMWWRASARQSGTMDGMMERMMGDQMPAWMMSRDGMGPQMMRDMHTIHGLLVNHRKIQREVEDIPGGVQTITRSEDPEVTELIRTHVHQMNQRLETGQPIRMMDPVFREIFKNHEKIRLQIEDVPGGARVIEQSDDPQVVLLIRQHAHRAVSEFVKGGMQGAMQPTPLPQGYSQKKDVSYAASEMCRRVSAATF